MVTIEDLQTICKEFQGVTEDIKWENHLCFNVGGKMFLITAPDDVPVSASLKTNDEDFDILSDRAGFQPAPYLARYKWIRVDDISLLSEKQWKKYLASAYDVIFSKLPAKTKQSISGAVKTSAKAVSKKKK